VAKVKPDASGLDYATLLGGTGGDQAFALALDSAGHVYVTGETASTDFPITTGAFQTKLEAQNAFVTALDLSNESDTRISTLTSLSSSALSAAGGQSVTLTAKVVPTTGTTLATGQVAFSGQACSTYQHAIPSNYWTNCTAIPAANAPLNSAGVATRTVPALKDGSYSYYATYLGDTTHSESDTLASASPLKLLVSGPPATMYAGPVTEDYGTQFPIDVTLLDAAGFPMEGYTINAIGHGIGLEASSGLTDSTGVAYFNATGIAAGTEHVALYLAGATLESVSTYNILKVPLTVQLQPGTRLYGGPLPAFNPIFTGLVNGDTVTVTPQTTATLASPVGSYPVTATVSGAAAANYNVTVLGTTMTVTPAPLVVQAKNEAVTYGQTPAPPTAYNLVGFVNGDTASIVTGKPILSTTVTSQSPVGFYTIGVAAGTLAAPNYAIKTVGNGMGSVGVYKAPLTLTVASQTIHQGSPIPALTYTLTGFLNLDTAATTGTLASHNYGFSVVNGILTILP
jgi:hypothetical protein